MKKNIWNLKNIKSGFDGFFRENKRYPTATEIDNYPGLPSSRQIQRRFGGLASLRRELKLDCQDDLTKGEHSSRRAKEINKRASRIEKELHTYLVGRFGNQFVHREYPFGDDRRVRTDFFVFSKNGNFAVDAFYPKDTRNLIGCLNSKMSTYAGLDIKYPVIFLMMNESISAGEVAKIISRKKNKLQPHQLVMTFKELQEFCLKRKAI